MAQQLHMSAAATADTPSLTLSGNPDPGEQEYVHTLCHQWLPTKLAEYSI